jgi:putative transposase
MRRKSENGQGRQVPQAEGADQVLRQLLLPMIEGALESRRAMFDIVQQAGLSVVAAMFDDEVDRSVGPKGKRQSERDLYRWGTTRTAFPFAGRMVTLDRPRVRSTTGKEVSLPMIEELQKRDPVPERVVEQILLGVTTRGYDRSLPHKPTEPTRGASKSAASRHVVARTREKVTELRRRRLDDFDLIALMLDGVHVAGRTVVVALGIARNGEKQVLGFYQGSTENGQLCVELLQDLITRGLRVDRRFLAVIDGSKALRKALGDVFGDQVRVQRCRIHKQRNLRAHLPEKRHAYVIKTMNEAYQSRSAKTAKAKLQALAKWLRLAGEETAANSLEEGLAETLTIHGMNLSETLGRFFSSSNAVENLIGSFRKTSRNVKRWRDSEMVCRWAGLGLLEAEKKFRRIRGYQGLGALAKALDWGAMEDSEEEAA